MLAALDPANLLVSTNDTAFEYTPAGTQVQAFSVPYPGGRPVTESARDLIVNEDNLVPLYNGTFSPFLSTLDPVTATWTDTTHPSWSTANDGTYGGIAAFKEFVFVTDMNTVGGSDVGVVRFDTSGGSPLRFADTEEYIDLNLGMDGRLYALQDNETTVDVFDPTTLAAHGTVSLGTRVRGIAVNESGAIFGASWDREIYHFDSSGAQQNSVSSGNNELTDIDINEDGDIVVGTRFGNVLQTDETLGSVTTFSAGTSLTFVAFARRLLPSSSAAPTVTSESINGSGNTNRSGIANLLLGFDRNVAVSSASFLNIREHATGSSLDLTNTTLQGNGSNELTWDLSGVSFSDGYYTATLPKTATTPPLDAIHDFLFHVLAGDSNGNAQVDFGDFSHLANKFNTINGPIYGPGDLDGNGAVNFNDFGILANAFNKVIRAPIMDFGDAFEAGTSFPTTLVEDGARHVLGSGLFLGSTVDGEPDGRPDINAAGDGVDEDGATFGALMAGANAGISIEARTLGAAVLNAWIDFNRDGDWDDVGEQIFVDQALNNGTNVFTAAIPSTASAGSAFARFRVSSNGGYSYYGLAADGEVEDYVVTIVPASQRPLRGTPAATINVSAGMLIDDREDHQPRRFKTVRLIEQTVWTGVEPTPIEGVDSAAIEVVSTERQPKSVDTSSLDDDLVDQVFKDTDELLLDVATSRGAALRIRV